MGDSDIPSVAGTPAPEGTSAALAVADQHLAAVRDLVDLVRDHQDAHGVPEVPHPGWWAWQVIQDTPPGEVAVLLGVALSELAALGYGRPGETRYGLTPAGRRALADALAAEAPAPVSTQDGRAEELRGLRRLARRAHRGVL